MDMEPLKVPASLESLGAVGRYVMSGATLAEIDRKRAYQLRLAVDEIVTNIIIHGYEEAGLQGDVELRMSVDDTSLRLVIEDTAIAFDPREVPEPAGLDDPLEDRAIGGLGVYLALRGADEFQYERVDNSNRNIFIVHRAPVPLDSA